jgi:hypothetical protein
MSTPGATLRDQLAKTARRIGVRGALNGASIGVIAAATWTMAGILVDEIAAVSGGTVGRMAPAVAGIIVGGAFGWWRSASSRRQAAVELERQLPRAQNLLVTASELAGSERETADVRTLVLARADHLAKTIDVNAVLSLHVPLRQLGASALVWIVALVAARSVPAGTVMPRLSTLVASAAGRVEVQRVTATVTPPRYAQRRDTVVRDPARVDALMGSTVTFAINASADTLIVVTRQGTRALTRASNGTFALTLAATRDDFASFEPRAANGTAGPKRLIGISVRTDESPRVRIVAPAKDLVVPDSRRTLDIRVEADDDLAIGSLRLRYTKVSGSGERFTFSEGEVPVSVARANAAQWTARGALSLEPLLQEPGDLVVYRAVATDTRPGSPPIESDAFIAELASPGGVAALGFSLDPDEDRYALSQQMVILKTEKLIASRATMAPAAVADAAAQLAGEQRRVRAEFVFMMGGEFAQEVTAEAGSEDLDETHEAESESDLAAGRMVNRGRTALLAAVRAMSRAAGALTTTDLAPALASEKIALRQLQEAFARQRFLMRALSQREQLDPTRRLSGRLDSIAHTRASIPEGERDAQRAVWRQLLADLMAVGGGTPRESPYAALAERVLQLDASTPTAQRIAGQLSALASANGAPSTPRTRMLLDSIATALTQLQLGMLRPAAGDASPAELRRLQSNLDLNMRRARADAARRMLRGRP